MSGIILSKLSKKEKLELYNYLKNYYIEYQKILGLKPNMTFGLEMEFVSNYSNLKYLFNSWEDVVTLQGETSNINYYGDFWQLMYELNLEERINGDYGYELVSPILTDEEDAWEDLKAKCQNLDNFTINNHCGAHIHFGASQCFSDDPFKLINFFKFYALYEDILTRFACGEYINVRSSARVYAKPIGYKIREKLNILNTKPIKMVTTLKTLNTNTMTSVQIDNYVRNYLNGNSIDTIEFRSPNGTLNPIIWQNNINAFGKFLEYSTSSEFDEAFINHLLSHKPVHYEAYEFINYDKVLQLVDLIFDNIVDKMNFLRQYIKDGRVTNSKVIVKSAPFWK